MAGAVGQAAGDEASLLGRDANLPRMAPRLRRPAPSRWPWFLLLLSLSCGMTLANKYIMVSYSYANTLMLVQNGVAAAVLLLCHCCGYLETKPFTLSQLKTFMLPSLFVTLEMYTSLLALPHVAIATTVIFRNASLVVVALADCSCMGTRFSAVSWVGLALIVGGSFVYADEDITYDETGYFWLGINAFVYIFACFYNKYYITKSLQTPVGISLITNTSSLPCILCTAAIDKEQLGVGAARLRQLPARLLTVVAASALGALLISTTYTKVYKIASATAVTVCGNVSKALGIVAGHVVFGTVLSRTQSAGLAVCMVGGLQYSLASKAKRAARSGEAEAGSSDSEGEGEGEGPAGLEMASSTRELRAFEDEFDEGEFNAELPLSSDDDDAFSFTT